MSSKTEDLRIVEIKEVVTPQEVHNEFPVTGAAATTVANTRQEIHEVLHGKDDRLVVIVGPCSIHDVDAALDYAKRLKQLRDELSKDLLVIMRVYFEKPRTTVGWKGLINDPGLDDSYEINKGLRLARKLLLDINDSGLPAGTEFLDLVTPQYVADLVSWGAIGARTTESQVHRELASGLSAPVGFKNGTDGTLSIAIDAVRAATRPHNFLSMTKQGRSAIFSTKGNDDCHIILRGGKQPNYDTASVDAAVSDMEKAGISSSLMIDFSHANSNKDYRRQAEVAIDVAQQIAAGNRHIMGVMIESHINEGRQNVVPGETLEYGMSITDACINWDQTVSLLQQMAQSVRDRRKA